MIWTTVAPRTARRGRLDRRIGAAAVGLCLAAATVGCGTQPPDPARAPSMLALRDALVAAAPEDADGPLAFSFTEPSVTGSGVSDPAVRSQRLELRMAQAGTPYPMTVQVVLVDPRSWIKISFAPKAPPGLPRLPTGWMRIDPEKVTGSAAPVRYTGPDPARHRQVFQGIVDVSRAASGEYTGLVDLTAAPDAGIVGADELAALGEQAKRVPFTATVDGQDRLTSVTYDVPAAGDAKAYRQTITYTDHGRPQTIEEPTGRVVDAPPAVYQLLNS